MKPLLLLAMFLSSSLPNASAQHSMEPLPALGADLSQTTVSGISSGGFMAAQLATAYSSRFKGVGIVAAGPFYCAHTNDDPPVYANAINTCLNPPGGLTPGDAVISWKNARGFAAEGRVDSVDNLRQHRVYAFSGGNDQTVRTIVVQQAVQYYRLAGVTPERIKYESNAEAGHGFVTDDSNDLPCATTGTPYINNCRFRLAHELLRHLYPERTAASVVGAAGGRVIRFQQREFVWGNRTSMDDDAYVYVPDACRAGGCAVHVALHGCRQGASDIGPRFYRDAGYNSFAGANRLIVLYPQVHRSDGNPINPSGCWDFWGYSNEAHESITFATRQAPQMKAVLAMIERLGGKP